MPRPSPLTARTGVLLLLEAASEMEMDAGSPRGLRNVAKQPVLRRGCLP